ncbi:unnamed protein product, partial [Allacma fusca]
GSWLAKSMIPAMAVGGTAITASVMMQKDPEVHILHHNEEGDLQIVPYDPEAPSVRAREMMEQNQQQAIRQAQQPLMQPRFQD